MPQKIEQWKEDYIILKHIFLDFSDYPNLGIRFPIGIFLILLAIALPITIFILNKRKNDVATIARQLVRHSAFDEASAKTLRELRLDTSASIKRALKGGGILRSMIGIADRAAPSYAEYSKLTKEKKKAIDGIDFSSAKFYIKEEKQKLAENLSADSVSSIARPAILSLVSFVIIAILFIVMPNILEAINSAFVG